MTIPHALTLFSHLKAIKIYSNSMKKIWPRELSLRDESKYRKQARFY